MTRACDAFRSSSPPVGMNTGTGASSGDGSFRSGTMTTSAEVWRLLKLMSRIHMTGPGLATRGSAPSLASSRLSSSSPVPGYQSRPPLSSPTTLTLMGTISLLSWLRYSGPGSKTL